jgi:hypothetical protein
MAAHEHDDCKKQEEWGKVKEFMESMKGFKASIVTIAVAVVLQVCVALVIYGSLTSTVKQNTRQVWDIITPQTTENMRNIDKILGKLDSLQIVTVLGGQQGTPGKDGKDGKDGSGG